MDCKRLVIRGISYGQNQTGTYVLILEHPESSVKLPIIIGDYEAKLISLSLEKDLHTPRPTAHDLLANFIRAMNCQLQHILIHQIVDGIFFSNLVVVCGDSPEEEMIIDSRTSDAVLMAIKSDVPIYVSDQVLHEAGVLMKLDGNTRVALDSSLRTDSLDDFSVDELQLLLDEAVQKEDFAKASKIHGEIKKREGGE